MFLPTKEYCDKVVDTSEVFYRIDKEINGYQVVMYNYRLADYSDFVEHNAFEFRGLTFMYDGKEWRRFLMLHKFFNVNQTTNYEEEILASKYIVGVYEKLDGSMITFVQFPDGKVLAKTKMGFDTPMAIAANRIYEADENIKIFVDSTIKEGKYPIFEYISPFNRIVVGYDREKLKLIALRDSHGRYEPFHQRFLLIETSVSYVPNTLSYWMEKAKESEGVEGWVVQFSDGMAKVKTQWYMDRHRIYTEDLNQENTLIELILNEKIDDIIAELKPSESHLKDISILRMKLIRFFAKMVGEIITRKEGFIDDRKKFVEENKDFHLFPVLMKCLTGEISEHDALKDYVLKKTFKLDKARKFLEEIK